MSALLLCLVIVWRSVGCVAKNHVILEGGDNTTSADTDPGAVIKDSSAGEPHL